MTWAIERTPAGKVLPAKADAQVAQIKVLLRVLPVELNCFLDCEPPSTDEFGADNERIAPHGRPAYVNGVRRHFPILRPAPDHAVGFCSPWGHKENSRLRQYSQAVSLTSAEDRRRERIAPK